MLDLWTTATGRQYQDYSAVFANDGLEGWSDVPRLQQMLSFSGGYAISLAILACFVIWLLVRKFYLRPTTSNGKDVTAPERSS
jgi:hypothetical protein